MDDKIEKVDERLRNLEILFASKNSSFEKSLERSARGIKRAEKTRIKHGESIVKLKTISIKTSENQQKIFKLEEKIKELNTEFKTYKKENEESFLKIREKIGSFGKINVLQILVVAVSTYLGTIFGRRLLK